MIWSLWAAEQSDDIATERMRPDEGALIYFPILRVRATGFQPVCFS